MADKTVTHVVSSLHLGGAERFVLDLSSVQKDNNWRPQIISFGSIDDTLVAEANSLNIPLKIIDKNLSKKQRFTKIIQIFATQKDSILHIHSPAALKQAAMFLFLNRLNRVQVIYTRHGCAPLAAMNWRIVHFIARPFIHQVTFVSRAGLEAFRIHYPWHQSKLKVIENGVLVPSTAPKKRSGSITDRPFRIGSVGRMVALKGQINLLKALQQIKNQHKTIPEVHFFGSGPEQDVLQKFVEEQQLESLVFFHGTVLNRQKVYDSIDLLVVCSETEGLSLAIMESMARGIPVIATDVGGNPQLVTPNETGFLVQYNEVEPLVQAILAITGNPTLYDSLAENAKRFITSKYSLQTTLEQYFQAYR